MHNDLPPEVFRAAMHRVADQVADYLEKVESYSVLPPVQPGQVAAEIPAEPPLEGEAIDTVLDDYARFIEPNVTHWNHPGFMAYFAITGSAPGILGEALAASLNVNAMLWHSSPAATELEERTCDWLRGMMGLPEHFGGHINDTASISTFLALAAARDRALPEVREKGLLGRELPALAVYTSEQAHSSIDKAAIALGLGLDGIRRIATDAELRMKPDALRKAIAEDREAGVRPAAVMPTLGTTSTAAIDPVGEIADIAEAEDLWLHIDAAYGGSAAICPELRELYAGMERADSIVVNPHKWLFVPVDCSVLYLARPDELRQAFSLLPEYLKTPEEGVSNLMDYGIQLGRRFRALKLWFVIRAMGVEGLRSAIRQHCELAAWVGEQVVAEPGFERVTTSPLALLTLRALTGTGDGEADDALNEKLLAAVNADGAVMLSHTRIDGRYVLRLTVGNLKTERRHVETAWRLLREHAARLQKEMTP